MSSLSHDFMDAYYNREFVRKMQGIFGNPQAPTRVTQVPLDGFGEEYEALIRKQWHQIGQDDWWNFLNDMSYVQDLQQDLFDFVFPALLINWRDGMTARYYAPASESDFFMAVKRGCILDRMMDPARRGLVEAWMVDAFCSEVATIDPEDVDSRNKRNDNRDFFLWMFNAIGQVVPILGPILERLGNARTPGPARYWLVAASGLCFPENGAPWIAQWTPTEGGGGVYLLESHASLFDDGFLNGNLEDYRRFLTFERLGTLLEEAGQCDLLEHERTQAQSCLRRLETHQVGVREKLAWYLHELGLPDLGGVQTEPGFFA